MGLEKTLWLLQYIDHMFPLYRKVFLIKTSIRGSRGSSLDIHL